jgi:glyoxylase-like metal-dependent hydrolase (beta-lactamase superfamily II)
MSTKVHAIQTGLVKVKLAQMSAVGAGIGRFGHVLFDRAWSDWVPILAWLIEHDEGLILVDTGETARVHDPGYHPRWHPFYRLASRFRVTPDDELGPRLKAMGVSVKDIRHVVLTHLHTDHAGGLGHVATQKTWVHPLEWVRAQGIGGRIQGYLPNRWPRGWQPERLRFERRANGPFVEQMPLTTRGDVTVVPTPGHTPGHVSVIVRGEPSIFIAGDTSYTEALLKAHVVDGVNPDERVTRATGEAILQLASTEPIVYLPSHDPESAQRLADRETLRAGPR